jgi:hypothetical protein
LQEKVWRNQIKTKLTGAVQYLVGRDEFLISGKFKKYINIYKYLSQKAKEFENVPGGLWKESKMVPADT